MTEYNFVGIIKRIINQHQEILNDWEIEFIASVYEWHVLKSGKLSDKQKKIILKLNGKCLGRNT